MGIQYNTYLESDQRIWGCSRCHAHFAISEDIISKNFRGQHGKAYLFEKVVNVIAGEPVERGMTTGRHIVQDIACRSCRETVGWRYTRCMEASEVYKQGKYILEMGRTVTVT